MPDMLVDALKESPCYTGFWVLNGEGECINFQIFNYSPSQDLESWGREMLDDLVLAIQQSEEVLNA